MAKEKTAVYFQPETMRKIEQEYKDDNCASKTEFIEKAVRFYIGYLRQQEEANYLSPLITETVKALRRKLHRFKIVSVFQNGVYIPQKSAQALSRG